MTKAESQARAYAMENLEGYHPMVRDFILGKGIFSHAEEFKMHMRVADRIAEHARAAFREQFAKEFNDHRANAVVEVPIPPRKNVMPHAWSSDPARDAKVRMQEDGRSEPHKTLAEAISAARAMMPKSVSGSSAPEQENKGNGMRTERVTLEVTHNEFFPVSEWSWITMLRLRPGESVSVVEEEISPAPQSRQAETRQTQAERIGGGWWFRKSDLPSPPPPPPPAPPRVHRGSGVFDANGDEVPWEGVVAAITEERDAAIREREKAEQRADRDFVKCGALADKVIELRARVAELEAAPVAESATTPPPARGWLTEDEREAVQWAADAAYDKQHPAEDTLRSILARSTPPEVVLPRYLQMQFYGQVNGDIRKALAAAGVTVREATK